MSKSYHDKLNNLLSTYSNSYETVPHTKTFPLKKSAKKMINYLPNMLHKNNLNQINMMIEETMHQLSAFIREQGHVPVNDARVRIEIIVEQRTVDAEVTPDGELIVLPEKDEYVTVSTSTEKHKLPWYQEKVDDYYKKQQFYGNYYGTAILPDYQYPPFK